MGEPIRETPGTVAIYPTTEVDFIEFPYMDFYEVFIYEFFRGKEERNKYNLFFDLRHWRSINQRKMLRTTKSRNITLNWLNSLTFVSTMSLIKSKMSVLI